MDYAKHIRQCREKLGLTGQVKRGMIRPIELFAASLEVSPRTIERYEQGRCKPSRAVLRLLEQLMEHNVPCQS